MVQFDVSQAQARVSSAQGRAAADEQAGENRRARIAADQKAIQQSEHQLDVLDPSWRRLALLSQYAAGVGALQPTWEQIKAALTQRYETRQGATSDGARRYVQKVAHLYFEMCGPNPPGD